MIDPCWLWWLIVNGSPVAILDGTPVAILDFLLALIGLW